jgi:hypothetical protein
VTPSTNSSCFKSFAGSSNTHVPADSSQYGAITMIWFAIDWTPVRLTTDPLYCPWPDSTALHLPVVECALSSH